MLPSDPHVRSRGDGSCQVGHNEDRVFNYEDGHETDLPCLFTYRITAG